MSSGLVESFIRVHHCGNVLQSFLSERHVITALISSKLDYNVDLYTFTHPLTYPNFSVHLNDSVSQYNINTIWTLNLTIIIIIIILM